jgi:hypothetical protein
MPRYMFLIYGDEAREAEATPEDWQKMLDAHNDWQASVTAAGATIEHGDPLAPTSTATSVRHSGDGAAVVTDGPFAETKEALGGFYLVQCADLDVALSLAKSLPAQGVEVRPVVELPG